MRTCGNPYCKNIGKTWDTKHHSMCPYCPKPEMEKPNIEFEGKKYYLVGCRKCQEGENWMWNIGSDGSSFVAQCRNCGHKILIDPIKLRNKPDENTGEGDFS